MLQEIRLKTRGIYHCQRWIFGQNRWIIRHLWRRGSQA